MAKPATRESELRRRQEAFGASLARRFAEHLDGVAEWPDKPLDSNPAKQELSALLEGLVAIEMTDNLADPSLASRLRQRVRSLSGCIQARFDRDANTVIELSRQLREASVRAGVVDGAPPPVPMLLTCPMCRERHIDEGAFATKSHHTHACQNCGHVWRPAIVPTVGVRFLPGYKNAPEGK